MRKEENKDDMKQQFTRRFTPILLSLFALLGVGLPLQAEEILARPKPQEPETVGILKLKVSGAPGEIIGLFLSRGEILETEGVIYDKTKSPFNQWTIQDLKNIVIKTRYK